MQAVRPSILRALTAERAEAYTALLGEMLALRRSGVLAPTLDELRQHLSGSVEDEAAFLRDLLQLEEWGCISSELEPMRIRGHRDARRDRFRHRLTDDVVALLEWLETRSARAALPLRADADDRLLDVVHRARELVELTSTSARDATRDGLEGRRGLHLVRSIDAELDTIVRGLVSLHAEMRGFSRRSFEAGALQRIVAGLEAYVAGLLGSMRQRRQDLAEALARIGEGVRTARTDASPDGNVPTLPGESDGVLFAFRAEHGEQTATALLGTRPGDAVLELGLASSMRRWCRFLEQGGELDDHCGKIEAAAHDVIAALRARMSALERRGDRGHVLTCAIRALADIDPGRAGALGAWGFGTPTWAPGAGERLAPPLPRRKGRPREAEPRALPSKGPRREMAREPSEARWQRIAVWLSEAGLTENAVQLSAARGEALRGPAAPAAWIAIARAQHLGRSARLVTLGVHIEPKGGTVTLGDEVVGLAAPDCIVRPRSRRSACAGGVTEPTSLDAKRPA